MCGKLFFKGVFDGSIEIKCKACKNIATINNAGPPSVKYYVINAGSHIRTLNDGEPVLASEISDE